MNRMRIAVLVVVASVSALAADPAPPEARHVGAWIKTGAPRDRATRLVEDLPDFAPRDTPPATGRFGGLTPAVAKPTGFFRVERIDGRWWMIDPDGGAFINTGVSSVNVAKSSKTVAQHFATRFSDTDDWRERTITLLRDHGFNSTGSWSSDEVLSASDRRLPYAKKLDFMSGYGRKKKVTSMGSGHLNFAEKCMPAFDPEFEAFCDEHARALAQTKDDPFLIGYFSDNELPFGIDALDRYLKIKNPQDAGRLAAEKLMRDRHGEQWAPEADSRNITDEDREAFSELLGERYFGCVARAIRKHDPNHLYLGARFYGSDPRNKGLLRAAGRHVDVISVNLYGSWTPGNAVRSISEAAGRPVLVSEFYAKGADSGMKNTSGAGWTVATQDQRGQFYENFTLSLLESRVCVGWHWFRYQDNADDNPNADPSNLSSNKGIVSVSFDPYDPLLKRMRALNHNTHALVRYFDDRQKR